VSKIASKQAEAAQLGLLAYYQLWVYTIDIGIGLDHQIKRVSVAD